MVSPVMHLERLHVKAKRSAALGLGILLLSLAAARASAENVKVGIPSLTVTMMPLAVARERGFFQQEGLSVDLVLIPAALNIKLLLSGDLDYATTVGSAVVAALQPGPRRTSMRSTKAANINYGSTFFTSGFQSVSL